MDLSSTRLYRTSARQYFHIDYADIVGLLCLQTAIEGGESEIVSLHHIFNILQRDHPDVAETLISDVWYCGRVGERSEGQLDWVRQPLIFNTPDGVYSKWARF